MFYYLYEIRNNLNNKVYVGVHKTTNMNDGYMGSGKVIRNAIKKHGTENFTKTILETFDTQEEMFQREKEVVTDEFLAREDTYNLRRGGTGGFDHINKNGLNDRTGMIHSKESKELMSINRKLVYTIEDKKKISNFMKINNPMKNKEISNKVSKSLSNKPKDEEHRKKLSIAAKEYYRKKNAGIV